MGERCRNHDANKYELQANRQLNSTISTMRMLSSDGSFGRMESVQEMTPRQINDDSMKKNSPIWYFIAIIGDDDWFSVLKIPVFNNSVYPTQCLDLNSLLGLTYFIYKYRHNRWKLSTTRVLFEFSIFCILGQKVYSYKTIISRTRLTSDYPVTHCRFWFVTNTV